MRHLQRIERKIKSDNMLNILAAIFFVVLSFITWLSVSFKISGMFIDERKVFSNWHGAVLFYAANSIIALLLTIFCYIFLVFIQRV